MLHIFRRNIPNVQLSHKRGLWEWVNMMFNKPDEARLEIVGPDRACAEWVLRNGGAIRWKDDKNVTTDYNILPDEKTRKFLLEINASNSSVSHHGFSHLKGCKFIEKIILNKCNYIEDNALFELSNVESPLKYLEITSCHSVTDKGLINIPKLESLNCLVLNNLSGVNDLNGCIEQLRKKLQNCDVKTGIQTEKTL